MNINCIKCKGNNPQFFCGRSYCPIVAKSQAMFKVKDRLGKEDIFGSSPSPFVGRYGYPNVNVGILSVGEPDSSRYDAPRMWAESDYKIPQIVDLRSSLINSRFRIGVKQQSKFLEVSQEVGMAAKPVEMEIKLEQKPVFRLRTDAQSAPMGPNARLKHVDITSNPKIPHKVERVVDDSDLRATPAIIDLYKNNFDENFLTRLLSVGNLGVKVQRKLVPTRWSITAVDDSVGKYLIGKIKDYRHSDYLAFFGGYLGNYYVILFFPEVWSYELFESYLPRASWNISDEVQFSTDYEPYSGRKSYASECAGGYYAARLPILDKLDSMKRQASVLALRFITGEYYVPLGVWVVREAVRKTMAERPIEFESRELILAFARKLVKKKFGYELDNILKNSVMLREMKSQTKLNMYFS
jgi:hypothetical protein